jgi:hypothetical protein
MKGEVESSILSSGTIFARCYIIADRSCSRHADAMGRQPAERTAPDLFPTVTASALPAPKATTESEPRRYVLPKNLRNAVRHLSDRELDLMHAATVEELKRRGRTPKSVETDLPVPPDLTKIQSPPTETAKLNTAEAPLTRGQERNPELSGNSRWCDARFEC